MVVCACATVVGVCSARLCRRIGQEIQTITEQVQLLDDAVDAHRTAVDAFAQAVVSAEKAVQRDRTYFDELRNFYIREIAELSVKNRELAEKLTTALKTRHE